MQDTEGPQAKLSLHSPTEPLFLVSGGQTTLNITYLLRGQLMPGIPVSLRIDGSHGADATLCGGDRAEVVTDDHGRARVFLTAGAAEASFHVVASAPMADDLIINVDVLKAQFNDLHVLLNATQLPGMVSVVRAVLVAGKTCAEFPPALEPTGIGREQKAAAKQATLRFPTLFIHSYSVIGRAEDASSRLLAYGCVDIPDELLRFGSSAVLVPLSPVP